MKRHSTRETHPSRFLRRGGALAGLAALMLAAQPAAANRMVSGVTAQLHVADVQVREGERAIFQLKLSRPLDFAVRYAYRTEDGSARAGQDYEARQGHVVIPAGKSYAEIRVRTLKDDIIDKNQFRLLLSDVETLGYGMVWGRYVWTDWWRVEGLPLTKTVTAEIANALDGARQRHARNKRY